MKFTLRHLEDDQWTVIGTDDVSVFSGTLRNCEDWLDRRENRERVDRSLFSRISRWIFRRGAAGGGGAAPLEGGGDDPPRSTTARSETPSSAQTDGDDNPD